MTAEAARNRRAGLRPCDDESGTFLDHIMPSDWPVDSKLGATPETQPALKVRAEGPGPIGPSEPRVVADGEGTRVWAMGVQVTVKVRAEETGGAYSVFEDVIPPGGGPPPHTHSRENETIYVVEGELTAHLGDKSYRVQPGTWVHMPVGVEHWFKNATDRPTRLLLTYSPGGFEEWFLEIGTPAQEGDLGPPAVSPEDIQKAVATAERYGVVFRKR